MKKLLIPICILCFATVVNSLTAQTSKSNSDLNSSPIYDRAEKQLTNTDTIPDYRSKKNKLKLTGIIYQSDGVTPAKDVILFIEQPDEDGTFDLRKNGDERYVFHRSWVKTDVDGHYTFYTFVPGGDRRYNQLQQIFPLIKPPTMNEYAVETFLFDEDPLLTKRCRKQMAKKGDTSRILKLTTTASVLMAERNIVLKRNNELVK
ncbi:hypothetical protein [Winogradskyella wichelsiae]|uniref:hypothetical protein n=1 Tax=Winogradskyella wichelsiae TaxID=2697007 RepID=UPI0015C8546E|nr:hypothetical protein [Winogradskyella wichelsiae]